MKQEIAIISNLLNPLKKKENGLDSYWVEILNELYKLNNEIVDVKYWLGSNTFNLTSREQLQIIDINKDEHYGLEAFCLFLYYELKEEEHSLPFIRKILSYKLLDQKLFKSSVKSFIEDKELNIYLHNFAVSNQRITLFLNYLFVLFCLNLYKPSKVLSNKELFKKYQEFVSGYEFNKDKYKSEPE